MKQIGPYIYKCHTIELDSGRIINLIKLVQDRTYGGQLEGLPGAGFRSPGLSTRANRDLEDLRQKTTGPVVLVDARAFPVPVTEEGLRQINERMKRKGLREYDAVALGSIRCVTHFESEPIPSDKKAYVSSLTLLWYQLSYAMPIDEIVLQKIKGLDWDRLAENDYLGP